MKVCKIAKNAVGCVCCQIGACLSLLFISAPYSFGLELQRSFFMLDRLWKTLVYRPHHIQSDGAQNNEQTCKKEF
jgi:hypothetical protein